MAKFFIGTHLGDTRSVIWTLILSAVLFFSWVEYTEAQSGPVLIIGDGNVLVGQTTVIDIEIDNFTTGLSGYDIEFGFYEPQSAGVAEVTNGAASVDFGLATSDTQNRVVTIRAVDLSDNIDFRSGRTLIATITVQGNLPGDSDLGAIITRLDDDSGFAISVRIQPGVISVARGFPTVPGGVGPATDISGDGHAEDVNGNGQEDFNDIVLLFVNLFDPTVSGNIIFFDFDSSGAIDFADVVRLFSDFQAL